MFYWRKRSSKIYSKSINFLYQKNCIGWQDSHAKYFSSNASKSTVHNIRRFSQSLCFLPQYITSRPPHAPLVMWCAPRDWWDVFLLILDKRFSSQQRSVKVIPAKCIKTTDFVLENAEIIKRDDYKSRLCCVSRRREGLTPYEGLGV